MGNTTGMKNKTWIIVLVGLFLILSVPVSRGLNIFIAPLNYTVHADDSPWDSIFIRDVMIGTNLYYNNSISFSYEDGNIDDDLKTAYSDSTMFAGDDFEKVSVSESWKGNHLSELAGEGKLMFSPDFAIRYDATGDGDVDDRDDYYVYNDLYFENVTASTIKLVPLFRVGYVEDLKGSVFKLGAGVFGWENYLVTNYSEKAVSVVKVHEEKFQGSELEMYMDNMDVLYGLIPGTDYKIRMRNFTNVTGSPSADFGVIEAGVLKKLIHRDSTTDPPLQIGVDLELLEDYYVYTTKIDLTNDYITLAIGKKTDELFLYGNDRNTYGYDLVGFRRDNETLKRELIFQDEPIILKKGGQARLNNTNVYALYDEFGTFDFIAKKIKSAYSGSTLDSGLEPWKDFLKKDIKIVLRGENVEIVSTSIGEESLSVDPTRKKIVVVANSIDAGHARDLFQKLEDEEFIPVHVLPPAFENYKNRSSILILGGPDAYDGVGGIVQEVLTDEEQSTVRKKGRGEVYFKNDLWAKNQKIVIVAGSDRNKTRDMRDKHRREIVFSKLVRLKDIQCDNISNELLDKMKDSVWIDTGRSCIMCLACGCSCTTEDKWISEELSISVTSVSCGRDSYTLRFKNETYSCSTKEASKTPFVDFNELS